jgi:mono/diheme cytochrome c family protein
VSQSLSLSTRPSDGPRGHADPGPRQASQQRTGALLALLLVAAVPPGTILVAQQEAPPFPAAVLDSLIPRGEEIYRGGAGCVRCHDDTGRGTSEGPDLTDDEWLHGSGTYDEILRQVRHGISRRDARTGKPMPVGGWEPLDDDHARAVAVYVWSIGRRDSPSHR